MEDPSCPMSAWSFINNITWEGEAYWEGLKDNQYNGHLSPIDHIGIFADSHMSVLICEEA